MLLMLSCFVLRCCDVVCVCVRACAPRVLLHFVVHFLTGDRDGGRGGYGGGDRFGDKKMGPGGDFNPEFQRVSLPRFPPQQLGCRRVYLFLNRR